MVDPAEMFGTYGAGSIIILSYAAGSFMGRWCMEGAIYATKKYCDFVDKKESLNKEDSRQKESRLVRITEE